MARLGTEGGEGVGSCRFVDFNFVNYLSVLRFVTAAHAENKTFKVSATTIAVLISGEA